MERTELKWLTGGLGLLVVAMLFLFSHSLWPTSARRNLEDFLTISMPRPIKEMIMGFSLADRNVIRNLEVVAQKASAKKTQKNPGNTTKAMSDKGKKRAQDLKKAWADYHARQRAFRMRIVQESERYRRSLSKNPSVISEQQPEYDPYSNNEFKEKESAPKATENDKDKETLDASAWKSLVLSQPSQENVQKMIQAFAKGQIDAQTYYEIVETLMKDNSEEKRRMGFWALTSSAHEQGFTLAAHLAADASSGYQSRLKDYLYGYNRNQTLSILDQVLRGQDAVAASAAAQVIQQAITKLKAGQPVVGGTTDIRGNRVQTQSQTLNLASYQRFIPTLQWLSTSQGNTLSQWAQNILSQLRTTSTPA